jgi:tetratricopeptide (TPR) repeat protein
VNLAAAVLMCCVAQSAGAAARAVPGGSAIDALERALGANPESLRIAADYRQLAVAAKDFDRAIAFLENLSKRKDAGPNVRVSLALAYVDKVPTSGDIRRLYLGRDAMDALTKSIDQRPSVLAYWARGLINLYYNTFIFKRIPRGIADLEQALARVGPDTPPALVARVYTSLGDGHAKLENVAKAREVWAEGLRRFPADQGLMKRLAAEGPALKDLVTTALYAGTRVDTSLDGIVPRP